MRALWVACLALGVCCLRITNHTSHFRTYEQEGLKARALVVSCMDFRLINKVKEMMIGRGYSDNYDFFVLAGAALGYVQEKIPEWKKVLHDHLHYAVSLHHVKEVIFVDHLDCGLYKQYFGKLEGKEEMDKHISYLKEAKKLLNDHYPNLKFYGVVMDLEGKEVHSTE